MADASSKLLSEDRKIECKQQKDSKPKDRIPEINASLPDLTALKGVAEGQLQRTVVSQVIGELASDEAVANWIQEGLAHHTGDNAVEKCHFCGAGIPHSRIEMLEAHFNDEYNQFLNAIDSFLSDIEEKQKTLSELSFPVKAEFYDHLSEGFAELLKNFEASSAGR